MSLREKVTTLPRNAVDIFNMPLTKKNDVFFLAVRVQHDQDRTNITIDPECPVVVHHSDLELIALLQQEGIPYLTLAQMRNSVNPELSLVSGGAFFWLHDEAGQQEPVMPLLRRNGDAANGKLTDPNGLACEDPQTTMNREAMEELGLVLEYGNRFELAVCVNNNRPLLDSAEKRKQIAEVIKQLSNKDLDTSIKPVKIGFYNVTRDTTHDNTQVAFIVDNGETQLPYGIFDATAYFEDRYNTFNLRHTFNFPIPSRVQNVHIVDPESFGRKASLYARKDLAVALQNGELLESTANYVQLELAATRPQHTCSQDSQHPTP